MMPLSYNLAAPFYSHSQSSPGSCAIYADGREYSYGESAILARRLAGLFQSVAKTRRVGILATRSFAACIGILGTAWAGATYAPLNLKLPEDRLIYLLEALDLDALVVDARGAKLLTAAVLKAAPATIVVADEIEGPQGAIRISDVAEGGPEQPVAVSGDHTAYVEYTSGSTGQPKGVMVQVSAVNHYLNVLQERFQLNASDRMAETSDTTFDLSVHNMFLSWLAGAALYVISAMQMISPARFIRQHQVTAWFSVPSVISLMRQTRALEPGSLPSLRLTWFAGEALPLASARAWAEAAPNSHVENMYGPTETTIACHWQPLFKPEIVTASREIIAIGLPFPGIEAAIFDDQLRALPIGTPGEIAIAGPQVTQGYFGQPELTAARYPVVDGKRWYLSGDLGMQDENGVFHHLGRIDNQVKVLGNRIELEEVEMYLRSAAGSDHVAAVAWPLRDGLAESIIGFVVSDRPVDDIRSTMQASVVAYMVPKSFHVVDALPLNNNGKIDRKALLAMLDAGQFHD